jgi:hypothetical protein
VGTRSITGVPGKTIRYYEQIDVHGQEGEEFLAAAASLKGEIVERP